VWLAETLSAKAQYFGRPKVPGLVAAMHETAKTVVGWAYGTGSHPHTAGRRVPL